MVARAAMVVVATAVLAWLAVGLWAARLSTDGGDGRLRRAAALTPDKDPSVDRARRLARHGEVNRAIRILRGLVGDQPRNAAYWAELARVSTPTHPRQAAMARARLHALVPDLAPA